MRGSSFALHMFGAVRDAERKAHDLEPGPSCGILAAGTEEVCRTRGPEVLRNCPRFSQIWRSAPIALDRCAEPVRVSATGPRRRRKRRRRMSIAQFGEVDEGPVFGV